MQPDRIEEWIESFIARRLAGGTESVDEFIAQHPEHAQTLRRRLKHLDALERIAPDAEVGAAGVDLPPNFDGYELKAVLGTGGMGVVYRARQTALQRDVAIKVIGGLGYLSARMRERFEREAMTLARIRHPNIVQVFGSGTVAGAPYVVMELIEGEPLAARLAERGRVPDAANARALVATCVKVARALDHAHELGVVHRDVKPSNVILDLRGEPILLDFGLARDFDQESMTATGEFVGTLYYTAPEQALGERVDRRADVYGLGATLFHLLTGAPPYDARTHSDLVRQIQDGAPSRARALNASLSSDLSAVLERAVALRPQDRYASCADFADDLQAALDGRKVTARSAGSFARFARQIRRRPALSGLIVVAGVAVALALSLRTVNARETARTREQEFVRAFREADALLAFDADGEDAELVQRRRRVLGLLQTCTELDPSSPQAWLRRAEVCLRLHLTEQAAAALDQAARLGASGFCYQRLRNVADPERNPFPRPELASGDWMDWAPIDRLDMGFVSVFRKPSAAVEILFREALRNEDPLLSPFRQLAYALHIDAIKSEQPVLGARDIEARLSLASYDRSLDLDSNDPTAAYNRAILIQDALERDLDLGARSKQARSSAERYLRSSVQSDPSPASIAAMVKFLGTMTWKGFDSEAVNEAVEFADRLTVDEIVRLDDALFSGTVETLAYGRRYDKCCAVLRERRFNDKLPGPFTTLVALQNHHAEHGMGTVDHDGLHALLARMNPPPTESDRKMGSELLDTLSK